MTIHVDFSLMSVGSKYSRKELAKLWGYASFNALARGLVAPTNSNKLISFITRERQSFDEPYENRLRGDELFCDGPTDHFGETRMSNLRQGEDELHVFYREIHSQDFTYEGRFDFVSAELRKDRPSSFVFVRQGRFPAIYETATIDESAVSDKEEGHRVNEGGRVSYITNRSRRNPGARDLCLTYHGVSCSVCGFEFSLMYGELGKGYMHVHHLNPLSEAADERGINPKLDLRPVCPNCHAMLHRTTPPLSIAELQSVIQQVSQSRAAA